MARSVIDVARQLACEGDNVVLHDVSDGGMAITIAEICIHSGVGARVEFQDWRELFSEDPHTFVAAAPSEAGTSITALAKAAGIPIQRVGSLGGSDIEFVGKDGQTASVGLGAATEAWRGAIRSRMES